MRVGVVGAGINGIMSAWALAKLGCEVTVFERAEVMGATSSASTKLLHGGIRYLEQGHVRLVREALRERTWWIQQAPRWAQPLQILIPVYRSSRRGRWTLRLGLAMYDLLAGEHRLGRTHWLTSKQVCDRLPELRSCDLLGAYAFYDAQMDDFALGRWAASEAMAAGVKVFDHHPVRSISTGGSLVDAKGETHRFDRLINVAGPWAEHLLHDSGIDSRYQLDLVRGSHLILDRPIAQGLLLEDPGSERVFFVLPYQGRTMIGTTEVRQNEDAAIECSSDERRYLLDLHARYFDTGKGGAQVAATFAGLRPLIRSDQNPSRATREYALERMGNLVTVFGGKWTTSRVLGQRAAQLAVASAR